MTVKKSGYTIVILLIYIFTFSSCTKDEDTGSSSIYANKVVTLFTTPNSLSGNGYTSIFTEALMKLSNEKGFELKICNPSTTGQGVYFFSWELMSIKDSRTQWNASINTLENNYFIFADAAYGESVADVAQTMFEDNDTLMNHMLVFETAADTLPCYTFNIEKYAPMYIAGKISTNFSDSPILMTAYKDNSDLKSAIDGFKDGAKASYSITDTVRVIGLSETSDGFNVPNLAEQIADVLYGKLGYRFIMPLAGQSNEGIYNASRNNNNAFTAGMDYEVTSKSDEVTFNVVVRIDSIVEKYVNAFFDGTLEDINRHESYNMESGAVKVLPVDYYRESIGSWIKYLYEEAIAAEEKYLKKPQEVLDNDN